MALLSRKGHDAYRLHDLIRRFARDLADRDDPAGNEAAVDQVLAYYHDAAARVDVLLTRQLPPRSVESPEPTVRHEFADNPSAIVWTRAELDNLLACADYVVEKAEGDGRRQDKDWVILFAGALAGFLRNDGLWQRSVDLQAKAIDVAGQIGAPLAAANSLSERAVLYRLMGSLDQATADLDRAIAIYRDIGGEAGEIGEAHALDTYGVVIDQGNNSDDPEVRAAVRAEATRMFHAALSLYRRLGNPLGEANVLQDQAMMEYFARDYASAIPLFTQAQALYQARDQRLGLAHAHHYLGQAQKEAGFGRDAAENLAKAQALYRELGNQLGEINALTQQGAALRRQDPGEAEGILNSALDLSKVMGSAVGQVNALRELAELRRDQGREREALDQWGRALEIAREHGLGREGTKMAARLRELGGPYQLLADAGR
jgi:tetratricopeptide (TPR) repeat protein